MICSKSGHFSSNLNNLTSSVQIVFDSGRKIKGGGDEEDRPGDFELPGSPVGPGDFERSCGYWGQVDSQWMAETRDV